MKNGDQYSGIDVDLWRHIAEKMNLQLEIHWTSTSLSQCEKMLETGEVDIGLHLLKTIEREKYLHFLQPPTKSQRTSAFYVLKGKRNTIISYEDLKNKRVGIVRKEFFEPFDSDNQIIKVYESGYHTNFEKLIANKVDATLMTEMLADYYVTLPQYKDLVEKAVYRYNHYDDPHPAYLTVSKRSKYMSQIGEFKAILTEMHRNGTVKRIFDRYIPGWLNTPSNLFAQ